MTNRFEGALVTVFVCVLAILCSSCCDRRIVSQTVSPSGEMVATVTATHCGPPGGDSSGVTIRPAKKRLFAHGAVVAWRGRYLRNWYFMERRSYTYSRSAAETLGSGL